MSNVVKEDIFVENPGMGLNAANLEGEMYVDMTSPMGTLSGLYYGLMFQLRKMGFETLKIDEWIDVSPVFKQYYDLTIQQKQTLEAQMKQGLGQIATAIHDYDLISHDLRKYKEYLDYFTKIEQGNEMKKKAKTKDEKESSEKMIKEGMQTLRSVFIDQVDAHTGEGIALRTITQRWPTIIVDFMRLDEKDVDQKEIAKTSGISEAEASILATKNKLFIEWRDNLFKPTLKERYQNVLRLVEARRTSVKQYTEMLKPVITRFKVLNDGLESKGNRLFAWRGFFQPASQAISQDYTRIWAFMPFGPVEKYKATREYLDEIPVKDAGFHRHEIEDLIKVGTIKNKNDKVMSLPVEPSIDEIVRRYAPKVAQFYKVKIDTTDIFKAREKLTTLYLRKSMERVAESSWRRTVDIEGGSPGQYLSAGATWVFSPYFVFLDIPVLRMVFRAPNGTESEDTMIENLTIRNRTQNVVIVTLLEIIAREKQLENYISQLLGEVGGADLKTIEELAKEQYPEIFGGMRKEEKKKSEGKDFMEGFTKAKSAFGDVLKSFGLSFSWLRARGPYEFAMDDRLAEVYQMEPMIQGYLYVLRYLQRGMGVPGIRL